MGKLENWSTSSTDEFTEFFFILNIFLTHGAHGKYMFTFQRSENKMSMREENVKESICKI